MQKRIKKRYHGIIFVVSDFSLSPSIKDKSLVHSASNACYNRPVILLSFFKNVPALFFGENKRDFCGNWEFVNYPEKL